MSEETNDMNNVNDNEKILMQTDKVLPLTLPVVHLNNAPVFPGLVAPIILPNGPLVKAVEIAMSQTGYVSLLMTKDEKNQNPGVNDLYSVGVTAKILKKINMSDGGTSVLLQGVKRFKVVQFLKDVPFVIVKVEYLEDVVVKDLEMDALIRAVRASVKSLSNNNPLFSEELRFAMINMPSPGMMADLITFTLSLQPETAQKYLEVLDVKERFRMLLAYLKKEQEVSDLQTKITKQVNEKINTLQREYFLKEQLKVIKKELGLEQDEKSLDINKLREKFKVCGIHEEGAKVVEEELEKISMIPETSPEYSVSRNYIDWLVSLPWSNQSKDQLDIKKARKILDKHHYGLEKVKGRILEYLAVRRLNEKYEGNILLFLGPPGVGKTSLGIAIAEAMGRKFYRFSLGGMRDEAEIKGHRRTYIGSLPGKIMQGIRRVGTKNPVIMLDEVDKLGISFQGDPASALLEVLDPEQNFNFVDHYLDVGFDLSQVLFICTANSTDTVPPALFDRLELIEFPGYIMDEKLIIADKYLIPKLLKKHGIKEKQFALSKETVKAIINKYARDPGIRLLEKQVSNLMRKVAMKISEGKRSGLSFNKSNIEKYLGSPYFTDEHQRRIDAPGIVTGLAWTAYGGDILFVESTNLKGKPDFKYTGQLGGVMKESAIIAYTYARKWILSSDKKNRFFQENEVHLHIPAGAIPKDGPSAGVTMCSSLISLATGKTAPNDLAMTGELSIVGKVLPVGGIKEKLVAAVRAGLKRIILPYENKKDLRDIPDNVKSKLKFYFAKEMGDVIKICGLK
ncbi:MAG: endopeptidase La [Proteobacteria bacterium]|nr:endopeptidase La [Pseudomonadota bacterium]